MKPSAAARFYLPLSNTSEGCRYWAVFAMTASALAVRMHALGCNSSSSGQGAVSSACWVVLQAQVT